VEYASLQKNAAPGGIWPRRIGFAFEEHILQKKQIHCQAQDDPFHKTLISFIYK
jgi:hypothetical protein